MKDCIILKKGNVSDKFYIFKCYHCSCEFAIKESEALKRDAIEIRTNLSFKCEYRVRCPYCEKVINTSAKVVSEEDMPNEYKLKEEDLWS